MLATSHKVTKKFFFDKTKTIRPKTWLIDFTKKPLMAYHLPKTTLHKLHSQFSLFFGGGGGCMSVPAYPPLFLLFLLFCFCLFVHQ